MTSEDKEADECLAQDGRDFCEVLARIRDPKKLKLVAEEVERALEAQKALVCDPAAARGGAP